MFTSSGPSGESPRRPEAMGAASDATSSKQQNWSESLVTPPIAAGATTSSASNGSEPPRDPPTSPTDQAKEVPREASLQPQLFIKDLKEGLSKISAEIQNFLNNSERPAWVRYLIVGGAMGTMLVAGAHGLGTVLAAIGCTLATLSAGLKENNTRRAISVVDTCFFALHFAAMNCWELVVSNGVQAVRLFTQSMIPESKPILGGIVAGVGIALSASLFCLVAGVTPGFSMEIVPVITIIGRGVAVALPKRMSAMSSMISLSMNTLLVPYFMLVTQSWFLMAFNVALAYRNYQALMKPDDNEKDVPAPRKSTHSESEPRCQVA